MIYDIAVIGGGIVGLSFAMQASGKFPHLRILLLEKEDAIARHQTGHNSGVIHSGVYYQPGSLKARLCVAGAKEMVEFCAQHGIPHQICGKLIVATTPYEANRLDELRARGIANGLDGRGGLDGLNGLRLLDRPAMLDIEPHVGGIRALHVPSTAITDYAAVAAQFAAIAKQGGVEIMTGAALFAFGFSQDASTATVIAKSTAGDFSARYVVNCAGLYSDRVAAMAGANRPVDRPIDRPIDESQIPQATTTEMDDSAETEFELMIVPFRGEYYDLGPARQNLVRALIYPVPDPRYPFLGVHFTRRISGRVDVGPNAVLAFQREGYRFTDFDFADALEMAKYKGFHAMARRHWKHALFEFRRSLRKRDFVTSCQRLVPELKMEDLVPGGSGVRAQAVAPNGDFLDDFRFVKQRKFLHVLNVPSPAATASLPIGREILKMVPQEILVKRPLAV